MKNRKKYNNLKNIKLFTLIRFSKIKITYIIQIN